MVYVTSDLHGAFDIHKINPDEFAAGRSLNKDDYLLVCGDFGCVWDNASWDRFWLNWLESLPWTTLFIDGNHENFDVLKLYPIEEWNGGKIRRIRSNVIYLMRGEIYDFAGKRWLAVGGGFSHDAAEREAGRTWWSEELFSMEEARHCVENLNAHGWKVDVVISHDVYASHPLANTYVKDMGIYPEDRVQQQLFLEWLRSHVDYDLWLCGHYHKDLLTFKSAKPCWMLFDKVEEIDALFEEVRSRTARENVPTWESMTA